MKKSRRLELIALALAACITLYLSEEQSVAVSAPM